MLFRLENGPLHRYRVMSGGSSKLCGTDNLVRGPEAAAYQISEKVNVA